MMNLYLSSYLILSLQLFNKVQTIFGNTKAINITYYTKRIVNNQIT